MILLDTSGLLALIDRGESSHAQCRKIAARCKGPLVTLDLVLAETDFLVLSRLGPKAERALVAQVVGGIPSREPLRHDDIARAAEIADAWRDQSFGLTDTALMAVAERLGAPVLTLDRRHFGIFRDRHGKPLELLP